jgi:hypothetical protein
VLSLHALLPSVPQLPDWHMLLWQVRLPLVQPEQSELLPQAPFPSVPQLPEPHMLFVQVLPVQLMSWQSLSAVQALLPSVPQLPDSHTLFAQVRPKLPLVQPPQSELELQSPLPS